MQDTSKLMSALFQGIYDEKLKRWKYLVKLGVALAVNKIFLFLWMQRHVGIVNTFIYRILLYDDLTARIK
jgi:hypothetical protein